MTISSPIRMVPEVGRSRPATIRRSVVLPHPDGPTNTINVPSGIAKSRSDTARVPSGNTLVIPSTTISAIRGLRLRVLEHRQFMDAGERL